MQDSSYIHHIGTVQCFYDHRPSTIDHLDYLAVNRQTGFTLIEMMVVIGVIAIVVSWAVPGIKKVYGDFRIMQTYDYIDTVLSAQRAFYLIFNEKPDLNQAPVLGTIELRAVPFLPAAWVKSATWVQNGKSFWHLIENPLYLFECIKGGIFRVYLRYNDVRFSATIPYYLDDLRARYVKKGYRIQDSNVSNTFQQIIITSPEYSDVNWFR